MASAGARGGHPAGHRRRSRNYGQEPFERTRHHTRAHRRITQGGQAVGKSASEIGQELEQTRSDAAEKIEKIEQQVTQSAESVKESLDWRHQVEQRPLMALGTAFLGGLMLGELTNGDQHAAPRYSY